MLLHTDAAQSTGKVALNADDLGVSLLSLAGCANLSSPTSWFSNDKRDTAEGIVAPSETLAELKNLEEVTLTSTGVDDLSPLSQLSRLRRLHVASE